MLLTSRWQLPGWPDDDHLPLIHPSYGDFLQMARQQKLPVQFLHDRDRLHRIYKTLHGNGRGLTFFIAALQGLDAAGEQAFLEKLGQAAAEIQTDMALDCIFDHLDEPARELLRRLPVFTTPVPVEGIMKLGLDMEPPAEEVLLRLLAVALVEKQYNHRWQVMEYQCNGLVGDWLMKQKLPPPEQALLEVAADYQLYLFDNERGTGEQALAVHRALQTAGRQAQADQFVLEYIVGWYNRAGLYMTLLKEWLPDICRSEDDKTRAEGLNQTGKQYLHTGDYDKAGSYLEQSLAIWQEIGDKASVGTTLNNISQIFKVRGDYDHALSYLEESLAISKEIGDASGLCTALFNMAHIYWQNKQQQKAMATWLQVYRLAKKINLAQVLQALENLANQLGLPGGGLEAWERLSREAGDG